MTIFMLSINNFLHLVIVMFTVLVFQTSLSFTWLVLDKRTLIESLSHLAQQCYSFRNSRKGSIIFSGAFVLNPRKVDSADQIENNVFKIKLSRFTKKCYNTYLEMEWKMHKNYAAPVTSTGSSKML